MLEADHSLTAGVNSLTPKCSNGRGRVYPEIPMRKIRAGNFHLTSRLVYGYRVPILIRAGGRRRPGTIIRKAYFSSKFSGTHLWVDFRKYDPSRTNVNHRLQSDDKNSPCSADTTEVLANTPHFSTRLRTESLR